MNEAAKGNLVPLILRIIHFVLQVARFGLVSLGLSKVRGEQRRVQELVLVRAHVWMTFELIFCILSTIMLASTIINLVGKMGAVARVQKWFSDNAPNFSFFYYVLLSLLALYPTMIGCSIPNLFNMPRPLGSRAKNMTEWAKVFAIAIGIGILNSFLYLVAAFFPVTIKSANEVKAEETWMEERKEEVNIQENSEIATSPMNEANTTEENSAKSLSGTG